MLKSRTFLTVVLLILIILQYEIPVLAITNGNPKDLRRIDSLASSQTFAANTQLEADGSYRFTFPIECLFDDVNTQFQPEVKAGGGYGYVWGTYWPESGYLEIGTTTSGLPLIKSISLSLDLSGSVSPRIIN